jgi:hypothetical protein
MLKWEFFVKCRVMKAPERPVLNRLVNTFDRLGRGIQKNSVFVKKKKRERERQPSENARVQQALTSAGDLLKRFLNNFTQRFCRFFSLIS